MVELAVIFMLVWGAAFAVDKFESDDSASPDPDPEPDPDPDPEPGDTFDLVTGDTIAGSDANDVFNGGGFGIVASGNGGNDVFTVDGFEEGVTDGTPSIFDGGAGDDLINVNAGNAEALGGEGDDTLVGVAANLDGGPGNDVVTGEALDGQIISGGEGVDTITASGPAFIVAAGAGDDELNLDADRTAQVSSADAGDGDDTVNATFDALSDNPDASVALRVTGGAGDDFYRLNILRPSPGDFNIADHPSGIVNLGSILVVEDFLPGDDFVSISIDEVAESPLSVTSLTTSQVGETDAQLELSFSRTAPEDGEINEVNVTVQLVGGAGLTESDFALLDDNTSGGT